MGKRANTEKQWKQVDIAHNVKGTLAFKDIMMKRKISIMGGKLTMDKRIFDIVRPETLALDIGIKMRNPDALVL